MSIQLEVGKTYASVLGQKVKIVKYHGGAYVGDNGSSYYVGGEWLHANRRSDEQFYLVEEWKEPTVSDVPHADIIRALLDGKQVQQEIHYVSGGYSKYEDLGGTTADKIRFVLTYYDRKFRVKPAPMVLWLVMHDTGQLEQSYLYRDVALTDFKGNYDSPPKKVLCVELDPDTLELLSARTEAP